MGLHWYKARFHGLRVPVYAVKTVWYALVGTGRLTGKLLAWWHWTDGWLLESMAVAAGRSGHHDAMNAHREGKKTRGTRGQILAAAAVAALVLLLVMVRFLPWWGWLAVAAVGLRVLARHGAPEGQPIIRAAIVPTAYQPPTPEVITRALGSLNIAAINAVIKDGPGLAFVSDVHRDGDGWGVELDLPYGVTASDIIKRREALAPGCAARTRRPGPRRSRPSMPGGCTCGSAATTSPRPSPPPTRCSRRGHRGRVRPRAVRGTIPRGQGVGAPLFETNWVIGAAPGQGKTTAVRVLNCGAALDAVCDLWIHELAGKGDLEPLAQVCYRYVSGLDDEAIAYVADSARMLRAELDRRGRLFKTLPREVRPDGKLTRELAASAGCGCGRSSRPSMRSRSRSCTRSTAPQIADDLAYVNGWAAPTGSSSSWPPSGPTTSRCPPRSGTWPRSGSA